MAMTEYIYKSLYSDSKQLLEAVSQYRRKEGDIKKNKYKYNDRTVRLVEERIGSLH